MTYTKLAGERVACKHLIGSPKEVCQGRGAKRGSCQELRMDQVLLLTVGISAGERDIMKVFPERVIKFKSSSIVLLCIIGIDL